MQNILEKSTLFLTISFVILKNLPSFQYVQNKLEATVISSEKSNKSGLLFFYHFTRCI